ncbi:MAG: CRISPR-associated helicase Cas3' [Anaerolineae bacterium]
MNVWQLWGKSDKGEGYHPLLCHMIDVAAVAEALWPVLPDGERLRVGAALRQNDEDAGRTVAFVAGLHDLGKASPAFQERDTPSRTALEAAGLPFPPPLDDSPCYHGSVTARELPQVLATALGAPLIVSRRLSVAIGGHHGSWPLPAELQRLPTRRTGSGQWAQARQELLLCLARLYTPRRLGALGTSDEEANAFLVFLSGLTSVSDWIGSDERYFPHAPTCCDEAQYHERALDQARAALRALGWGRFRPAASPLPFEQLFAFPPRPMQQSVIDLAPRLAAPSLVVIEAPTGEGKTEAALYLADYWSASLAARGIYVAMPTMATSNQMHDRLSRFLASRYSDGSAAPLLVHSQARWQTAAPRPDIETEVNQSEPIAVAAWFLPRKRSLLVPFGVGTVDQALLCSLQTRHFFVRLFGIAGKTVIFDEVHAYDTYMTAIFRRLLAWLRALDCSVVLLSATLPAATRRDLIAAYCGVDTGPQSVPYPAITWASGGSCGVIPLEAAASRRVTVEWHERAPEAVIRSLASALDEGGCAAVICNTVGRAQTLCRALRDAAIVPSQHLYLFHAHYLFAWRDEIEKRVLEAFGKEGRRRPRKAIVVATQVIEQSLDLDFDLMVSELAPVDLVLQRLGRLHRHQRHRPPPLAAPRLILLRPERADDEVAPSFGADAWVYERYILLRSFLALQGRDSLEMPSETQALIEAVYGPEAGVPPPYAAALSQAYAVMTRHEDEDTFSALTKLIGSPDDADLLRREVVALREDSPEAHRALQALTRLGPPTVSIVCLHQTPAGLSPEPHGGAVIDLDHEPDDAATATLARYTVNAGSRRIVEHFAAQEPPAAWLEHPLLRDHRLAIFIDGRCPIAGGHTLRLDRELGLWLEEEQ